MQCQYEVSLYSNIFNFYDNTKYIFSDLCGLGILMQMIDSIRIPSYWFNHEVMIA